MRQLRTILRLVPAAGLLAVAACGSTNTDPASARADIPTNEPFFLTGTITEVGHPWGYRMKGEPGTSYSVNEAFFTLAPDAVIQRADGAAASAADLTVGRAITIWITGAIAESLPVQVGAKLVVLK